VRKFRLEAAQDEIVEQAIREDDRILVIGECRKVFILWLGACRSKGASELTDERT